jgi:hypothetical protein
MNTVMALLYLATAGLIAYFRLGPVQRVMERLERDGAAIPAWFPLVFTAGPLTIGGFLLFQAGRYLRRSFVPPSPGPSGD